MAALDRPTVQLLAMGNEMFWVSEQLRLQRVRVHRTVCPRRDEDVADGQYTTLTSFPDYRSAVAAALELGRTDTADCAVCHPGVRALDGATRFSLTNPDAD